MSFTAHQLHIRLFLEGQEVPVVSAQVRMQIGAPGTATVQVVATDKVLKLKPRTLVHLFFYDPYQVKKKPDKTGGASVTEEDYSPITGDTEINQWAMSERYKLLFAGEVASVGFVRTSQSRQAVLQCLDFTSYWDHAKHYYHQEFSLSSEQSNNANFVGAGVTHYDNWTTSPAGKILSFLLTSPATYPKMKGLLGGIVHMLEAIGGVHRGQVRFRGMNDFFNHAEMRLRLTDMVGALEEDTTSAKLINHTKHKRWLNQQIQAMGGVASLRAILTMIFQKIHHQTVPCPAAHFSDTFVKKGTVQKKIRLTAEEKASIRQAAINLQAAAGRINQLGELTERLNVLPNKTGAGQPQAYLLSGDIENSFNNSLSDLRRAKDIIKGVRGEARKRVISTEGKIAGFISSVQTMRHSNSTLVVDSGRAAQDMENLASDLLGLLTKDLGSRPVAKNYTHPARLHSTLIVPDCWFVSPPRCNVLFPELYGQFSFNRAFLQETSRLQMTTVSEFLPIEVGGGLRVESWGTTKHVFHAPDIKQVREGVSKGSSKRAVGVLLPHEKFSGIIPAFQWMGNIKELKDNAKESNKRVDYAQRLANFLFFKQRFSARNIQGSGKFNPHLVAGFPVVVIDRFMSPMLAELYNRMGAAQAEAESKRLNIDAPTQYFGYATSITHNVDQNGGTTSFSLSHARTHDEDTEFLDVDEVTYKEKVGTGERSENASVPELLRVALLEMEHAKDLIKLLSAQNVDKGLKESLELLRVVVKHGLSREAALAQVAAAISDIRRARSRTTLRGSIKPLDRALRILRSAEDVIGRAEKASVMFVADAGGQNVDAVEDNLFYEGIEPAIHAMDSAAEAIKSIAGLTKEKFDITVKKTKKVPPEDVIRPSWFSDIYKNASIGQKVYSPLLGIGSITDAMNLKSGQEQAALQRSLEEASVTALVDEDGRPLPAHIEGVNTVDMAPDLEAGGDIETAINHIVQVYAFTQLQADSNSASLFVEEYHRREIATMVDVLGDLEILVTEEGTSISGRPGFHSDAYGDVAPMEGLVADPLPVIGFKEPLEAVGSSADPRRERYLVVKAYVDELRAHRTLRG